MARKQSEQISEEMEVLRSEINVLTEKDDATEDEVARADALLGEWKTKSELRDKALAREAQVEEVMRAALNPGNRESGDGAKRAPQYMKRTEAYTEESWTELSRSLIGRRSFDEGDAISRAKSATEGFGRMVDDKSKEHIFGLLEAEDGESALVARHILMTSSRAYRDEFRTFVNSGGQVAGELMRTAMSLITGNGGYLLPTPVDPTIVLTNAGAINPVRQLATVRTIAGTNVWTGVTSAGVTAEFLGEGQQMSDASPTFGQISIPAHRADAYIQGSWEILADANFATDLGMLFADAKANVEATAFATANTGATWPRGVVAGVAAVTASIVTSATTGAFVVGDVFNLYGAVPPRSLANLSFLANPKIYNLVRQMATGYSGSWWTTLGGGTPSELLGFPVYQQTAMAGAVGAGANVMLAGDFSNYYIVDRIGMSIQYVPYSLGANQRPTGQAGWVAYWRVGADLANANAFRLLQLNQTAAATALA